MKNPLNTGQLDGAVYLCNIFAVNTYLDSFPPGLGDMKRRDINKRRARFEIALEKMKTGETSLHHLGITADDCAWAISRAKLAKDEQAWSLSFQEAEKMLKEK